MSFVFAATRQHQLRSGMLQCRFTRSFYARNLTHYGCQMWEKLIKLTSLSTQRSDLAWFTVCQCCKQKHKLDGSQSFCVASKVMEICLAATYHTLSLLLRFLHRRMNASAHYRNSRCGQDGRDRAGSHGARAEWTPTMLSEGLLMLSFKTGQQLRLWTEAFGERNRKMTSHMIN